MLRAESSMNLQAWLILAKTVPSVKGITKFILLGCCTEIWNTDLSQMDSRRELTYKTQRLRRGIERDVYQQHRQCTTILYHQRF